MKLVNKKEKVQQVLSETAAWDPSVATHLVFASLIPNPRLTLRQRIFLRTFAVEKWLRRYAPCHSTPSSYAAPTNFSSNCAFRT